MILTQKEKEYFRGRWIRAIDTDTGCEVVIDGISNDSVRLRDEFDDCRWVAPEDLCEEYENLDGTKLNYLEGK